MKVKYRFREIFRPRFCPDVCMKDFSQDFLIIPKDNPGRIIVIEETDIPAMLCLCGVSSEVSDIKR